MSPNKIFPSAQCNLQPFNSKFLNGHFKLIMMINKIHVNPSFIKQLSKQLNCYSVIWCLMSYSVQEATGHKYRCSDDVLISFQMLSLLSLNTFLCKGILDILTRRAQPQQYHLQQHPEVGTPAGFMMTCYGKTFPYITGITVGRLKSCLVCTSQQNSLEPPAPAQSRNLSTVFAS